MTSSRPSRLLAVDIGNTAVKYALFEDDHLGPVKMQRHMRREPVVTGTILAEAAATEPDAILVCGVVPDLVAALCGRAAKYRILRFREDFPPLVEVGTSVPAETGDDRVAAASAAYARTGGAVVIVSAGTAITVDAVSAEGVFLGGAILPGPELALKALTTGTAQLPPVSPRSPVSAIGRDTVQAMLAGCLSGTAGAVDRLIQDIRRELDSDCPVLITGGAAEMLYSALRTACRKERALVLEGLILSYLSR